MRDALRRRVASRLRVVACIASCSGSCASAAAAGEKGRLKSDAAVARMNLGMLLSSRPEREGFSRSDLVM